MTYRTSFYVSEGIFSASLAQDIAQSIPGRNLPINWSTPYNIGGFSISGNCSSTALTVAPDGSSVVAGITCGSTSYVYLSSVTNVETSWTSLATPSGSDLRLSLDPYGFAAATTIESGGTILVTTMPIPAGGVVSTTLGSGIDAAPAVLRTQSGALEGVVASTPSAGVVFYYSSNDGRTFSSTTVGPLNDSNVSAVLNSVGSTLLSAPGGILGQVAITTVGQNFFALYTVLQQGHMMGVIYTSSDDGLGWEGPIIFPLSAGAMLDPELVGTQIGYVYASWLATAGTNLTTVQGAVFGPDGRVIQDPQSLPGGTGAWTIANRPVVGMAVDSFQRPLFVWATPAAANGNSLIETGAFLSVANAASVALQAVANVASPNLVNDANATTFSNGVTRMVSGIDSNASRASTLSYLDATRNQTAYLYQNLTITALSYFGEQVSGSGQNTKYSIAGGAVLTPAVVIAGGSGERPYGVIVSSQGIDSAATYLGVESDWLLASEGVQAIAISNPLNNATLLNVLPASSLFPPPIYTSTPLKGNISTDQSNTTMLSPTVAELSFWGSFAQYFPPTTTGTEKVTCTGGGYLYEPVTNYWDIPTNFGTIVTLDNQTRTTLTASSWVPVIYLQNLSADSRVSWTAELYANYTMKDRQTTFLSGSCRPTTSPWGAINPKAGYPTSVTMNGSATFVTTLVTQVQATQSGNTTLTLSWTNSMLAKGVVTLTPGRNLTTNPATGYVLSTKAVYSGNLQYVEFNSEVTTTSQPGGWNSTLHPTLSANLQTSSEAQQYQAICSFETIPNNINITDLKTVSGSNDTGIVTWDSRVAGLGILEYYEVGTQLNFSVVASRATGSGVYEYTAALNGLFGASFYEMNATVTESIGGCFSLSNGASVFAEMGQGFTLQAEAYPFDSISQSGGGEGILAWRSISLYDQNDLYTGGYLTYGLTNGTAGSVVIPIPSLAAIQTNYGWDYLENLTPAVTNASYTVQEVWNFSWDHEALSIVSSPLKFLYLQDTSGDGLTDVEKLNGWTVYYTDVTGAVHVGVSTANPSLYATNGLASDFLEKEYGLNPRTVDTASSHMLDVWNLTFNLKPASGKVPPLGNFEYWGENGSYNPFANGLVYSPGLKATGRPVAQNITNISASSLHGITSGDGAPWAANVLWSYSALQQFVNLSGVRDAGWLRAVYGTWDGLTTLTVEGKLSWGANPHAASTPANGIADGARVNALSTTDLSVQISNLYVTGLSTGEGYAALFKGYAGSSASGTPEFTNYSAPVGLSGGISKLTGYTIALPVNQTTQDQTLELRIMANESGTSTLTAIQFDNGLTEVNITYDMVMAASDPQTFGSTSSHPNGSLSLTFQAVAAGGKAPTYLWIPSDNSTVNALPVGLERYTGEQSFDIVVVNASSAITASSIPYPWTSSSSYSVSLTAGLNNFLIPREAFFDSALGQGILLGKNASYPGSNPTPPLLSGSLSTLTPFGGSNYMVDLGAYWQNRSIASGPGNVTGSSEKGTPTSSSFNLELAAMESTLSTNTGGLPSNPAVYSTVGAPPALQAILTLNITSIAALDLLLAGLMDNTTGGVNGTFQSIATQVPFFGLGASVIEGLANGTLVSQGVYGAPQYNKAPPVAGGPWGAMWNAFSAIVTNPFGTLLSVVGEVWTVTIAAETFLSRLSGEATALGGKVWARISGTIVAVGKVIVSALDSLLVYIESLVKQALSVVINPIINAAQNFDRGLASSMNASLLDMENNGSVKTSDGIAWARAFDPLLAPGAGLAIAITVVVGLVTPFGLGAGFLGSLILSVLPSIGQFAISGLTTGISSMSTQAVTNFENNIASYFSNIPKVDWETVSALVAIGASVSDGFFAALTATFHGLNENFALTLAVSVIIDMIVFSITVISWISHLGLVALAVLFFAALGVVAAVQARGLPAAKAIPLYVNVSFILALIGAAGAGADVYLTWS